MVEKKMYQRREDMSPKNPEEGWYNWGYAASKEEILHFINAENRLFEELQMLTPGGNDYTFLGEESGLLVFRPSERGPDVYFREVTPTGWSTVEA